MIDQFADELWVRIMLETSDMEHNERYLVRGVLQSALHDMKQAHLDDRTVANIMTAADHLADKGYQVGTKEEHDAFVSKRNAGS